MHNKRQGPQDHKRVASPTALCDLDICDLMGKRPYNPVFSRLPMVYE